MKDFYFQNLALKTIAQNMSKEMSMAQQKSKDLKKLEADLNQVIGEKQGEKAEQELGDVLTTLDQ